MFVQITISYLIAQFPRSNITPAINFILMNFFTFRPRTVLPHCLTQSEMDIVGIIQNIPSDTIAFAEQWVLKLLELFSSKQEMALFWTFFSQIAHQVPTGEQIFNENTNQINLEHEVLSAIANYNPEHEQGQELYSVSDMSKVGTMIEESLLGEGLSDLDLNAQGLNQIPSKRQYANRSYSQIGSMHGASSRVTNNQFDEETANSPIISSVVLFKLRKEFEHYRSIQQEFINVSEIAKKYCISEITLGRIIKKWSIEPQFSSYLGQIQKKQHLWPIKSALAKEIEVWAKNLEYLLSRNPYLTCEELKSQLKDTERHKVPDEKTISKILAEMKYIRKRVGCQQVGKNSQQNMYIRKKYCELYLNMMKKENIAIFFLDEHRYDVQIRPDYAWVRPGEHLQSVVNSSPFYISLIVLLSETHSFFYDTTNMSNGQPNIIKTLERLVQRAASQLKGKQVIVVANGQQISASNATLEAVNSPKDWNALLKQILDRFQWKLMKLPPKSSELNPTVSFFREIKDQLRKIGKRFSSLGELDEKIRQICPTLAHFTPNFEEVKKYASKSVLNCKF